MGYTTDFEGGFTVTPNLTQADADELEAFSNVDHRDEDMPGFYCQWVPDTLADGTSIIRWDYGEKFYDYVEWIQWLIENKLAPKGYVLNGTCQWQGEESSDMGQIQITDNVVELRYPTITWGKAGDLA